VAPQLVVTRSMLTALPQASPKESHNSLGSTTFDGKTSHSSSSNPAVSMMQPVLSNGAITEYAHATMPCRKTTLTPPPQATTTTTTTSTSTTTTAPQASTEQVRPDFDRSLGTRGGISKPRSRLRTREHTLEQYRKLQLSVLQSKHVSAQACLQHQPEILQTLYNYMAKAYATLKTASTTTSSCEATTGMAVSTVQQPSMPHASSSSSDGRESLYQLLHTNWTPFGRPAAATRSATTVIPRAIRPETLEEPQKPALPSASGVIGSVIGRSSNSEGRGASAFRPHHAGGTRD
jgi:hypothetical protein